MKVLQRLGGGLIVFGLIMGWKFYNKSNTAGDVKKQLIAICATDSQCVADVDAYYDSCFESSYDLGGRRRSGGLNGTRLATCINEKSGQPHFEYEAQ